MAIIARPGKTAGGTAYTDGTTALSVDVNADFDTIYNEFNGNIQDANIKAAAGIALSKLDDASNTDALAITIANPGTTDSPLKATDLAGEIQRLRYMDLALGPGVSAQYHNGSTTVTAGPLDGALHGPNLIRNGSIQLQSGGAGTAPDGWALAGSPSAVTLVATPAEDGDSLCVKAVSSGTSDGVFQTITGIKKNALYAIGCRARAAVNGGFFGVSGGASSGAFQNCTLAVAVSSAFSNYAIMVKADSSGSDINLQISSGTTSLDEIYVYDVWMYEVGKNPVSRGTHIAQTAYVDTETTVSTLNGAETWISAAAVGLDFTVTPERHNQRVTYSATINVGQTSFVYQSSGYIRLKENSTVVAGPHIVASQGLVPITFHYVKEAPAPGTALAYTLEVWDPGGVTTFDYTFSSAQFDVQLGSNASLLLEEVS